MKGKNCENRWKVKTSCINHIAKQRKRVLIFIFIIALRKRNVFFLMTQWEPRHKNRQYRFFLEYYNALLWTCTLILFISFWSFLWSSDIFYVIDLPWLLLFFDLNWHLYFSFFLSSYNKEREKKMNISST
jgi:hypothetical protein